VILHRPGCEVLPAPPAWSRTPSWSRWEARLVVSQEVRVQLPSGALCVPFTWHGAPTGRAAKLKPWCLWVRIPPVLLAEALFGWCSSRSRRAGIKPLPSSGEAEGERFDSFTTHWRLAMKVRSSIGTGHQPLKLERRVRFPHGPLDDSPGGGTGRRAGLRRTCPRGVGVRISLRRLILLQAGRCPAGPHKSGVPGSIPGPGTAGGPVLGRVSYARRRRFDSPTRNCRCSWHGTLTGIATRSRAWCLWVRIPPVLLTAIRPVV
jgi:hypothetical protein